MKNTAIHNEIWVKIRDLTEATGILKQTVCNRIKAGKYTARLVDGNGGKQYEILITSIEPEFQ